MDSIRAAPRLRTRLESGAIEMRREPADLGEVVGSALARAGKVLDGHRVAIDLAPDLPLLDLDVVLFDRSFRYMTTL